MSHNGFSCMEEKRLAAYIVDHLPIRDKMEIEEHLCYCSTCVDRARTLQQAYEVLMLFKAPLNYDEKMRSVDVVMLAAAGSSSCEEIAQITSVGGQYILRLIPFLHKNQCILEIEVLDKNIDGTLIAENQSGEILNAPIIDHCARHVVSSNIDLRCVWIYRA